MGRGPGTVNTTASNILGISAYYHDSAAALLKDRELVAAAQQERFSRKKHDARFPDDAIRYCLETENLSLAELDRIVFYDKPLIKFERLLETYLSYAPNGFRSFVAAMPVWLKEKLYLKRSELPAITHVDYSARVRTVHEDTNPRYYGLLKAFEQLTGCGVLVNTSFNVRGEPLVCTPTDAYRCFMRERKKFWLAPIILVMILLGVLIVFAQGSSLAPFIYTLF